MTNEQSKVCNELWSELLAADKVRWMAGMLPEQDDRVVDVHESGKGKYITLGYIDRGYEYGCNCSLEHSDLAGDTPAWDDPATLGCLTAMAREVTSSAMSVWRSTMTGEWGARHGPSVGVYTTEAETLLRVIKEAK